MNRGPRSHHHRSPSSIEFMSLPAAARMLSVMRELESRAGFRGLARPDAREAYEQLCNGRSFPNPVHLHRVPGLQSLTGGLR